jgi:serine/threonine protein kinase
LPAPPEDPRIATHLTAGSTILDRYVIQDVLGRGGMGVVYAALDSRLGRPVAVKVIDMVEDAGIGAPFGRSEAGMLAQLGHPGLVTLYDAVLQNGAAYLVMELVAGPTLRERVRGAPLHNGEAAALTVDLAAALHHIHDHGVVHRDVKPANILLAPSRASDRAFHAKLTDFGIARLVDSTRLTLPGVVVGTASYLSPEQAMGEQVGPASDVYSMGLVVLEALTGAPAFAGSGAEVLTARLLRDPVIPEAFGAQWAALLADMTRRDPNRRPTAEDVKLRAGRIADLNATAPHGEQSASPFPGPGRTSATAALTRPFPASVTATMPTAWRPAGRSSSAGATSRLTPRVKVVLLGLGVAALIVLVAIGGLVFRGPDPAVSTPSPLPSVTGSLGTHLKELMKGVTP